MDAVTYPNDKVIEFISQNVIALRVASDAQPLSTDFNVKWTPALVVLDSEGVAHQQTIGFFPPGELIPAMMLGISKAHFNHDQFESALAMLHMLQANYPKSGAVPEAVFYEGVSRYKHSHEPKALKEAYEQLQANFPASDWTQRAYPYRLI